MCVADNPLTYPGIAKVVRGIYWVYAPMAEPDAQTSGATKPAVFMLADERALFDITAATVDDVANPNEIPTQSLSILLLYTRDSFLDNEIVADILGHDQWKPVCHIVGRMKLASKWSSLEIAPTVGTDRAERGVVPAGRQSP
jgi:hypothetical protein